MSGKGFGQPQIPGWEELNVTNLRVLEGPTMPPPAVPGDVMAIVDAGEQFWLELTFELKGPGTIPLKTPGNRAKIVFHYESIGGGAEFNRGPFYTDLTTTIDTYTQAYKQPVITTDDIYRVGAVVTFEAVDQVTGAVTEIHAHLGFYEGCLLQVHHLEQ